MTIDDSVLAHSHASARNSGGRCSYAGFAGVRVDTSAPERRAETLAVRRTVEKEDQVTCLVKVASLILATGDPKTLCNVCKASMVAMFADTDFIKSSTGNEDVHATFPVSLGMWRPILDYERMTGSRGAIA